MIWFKRLLRLFKWTFFTVFILGFAFVALIIFYLEKDLPDVAVLKDVQLQTPLRIYTSDGHLMAEYGQKRRIPVPYDEIPPQLIHAVLSTEDQRFFDHPGVDIFGLLRAGVQLVTTGSKSQGGSTITMQVARNFFLSRKKTYTRKLKEILLAIKIDNELSKEKIMDLYLNKIYLGNRAYGVGAAAQVYYGKSLNELSLAQLAMIAGLPKAPSALNPLRNPVGALKRRNHVLKRMYEEGYITLKEYQQAIAEPLNAHYHGQPITARAPYVAEMVRATLVNHYGEDAYTMGLNVYTTINSQLAKAAHNAMRNALLAYDRRHGYYGPVGHLGNPRLDNLTTWLTKLRSIPAINNLLPAAVISTRELNATAMLANGEIITLPWEGLSWARKNTPGKNLGPKPKSAEDVLHPGDIIRVEKMSNGLWYLAQVPHVEGALVAINPQTGAIEALEGGFDYNQSNFNRVTQAKRQAGSSFKPFVYAAALEKGFTLASIINDAPVVVSDPAEADLWRPQNDTRRFYGPTRLRVGLTKSRNLVSIRLLDATGIPFTLEYLEKFGFDAEQLPHTLSLALGSGAVSPLELARGYAVFANGGYGITPYVIDYISNSRGEIIYQAQPKTACKTCLMTEANTLQSTPENNLDSDKYAPLAISPQIAFLMNSVLKDVVTEGTGRRIEQYGLKRNDIAGKTGTTNDQKDAWFAGYNGDLVTVAWVGFDQPKSIYEYGSKAALPMWTEFMIKALAGRPEKTMSQPPGIVTMRIDKSTGRPSESRQNNTMLEIFREGQPARQEQAIASNPYTAPNIDYQYNNNEDYYDENTARLF